MSERLFEGRTWKSEHGDQCLVLEPTDRGDDHAVMWIGAPGDGPSTYLTAAQMRSLSVELVKRADKIDPPKPPKWVWGSNPPSPEAMLAAFLSDAKTATEHVFEDPLPKLDASWIRSMHVVETFTVVVLLGELIAAAPKRARAITELLHGAYEDGGVIHEWIGEWHEKHAKGQPFGFDPALVLELEVERPEEYR